MNKKSDYKMWGKSIHINLYGCDLSLISDPKAISEFVNKIIKIIDMVAYGPIHIDRFGEGEIEGYSAMQFIETSAITVHADEPGRRCFVDIFSCKDFDEEAAVDYSKRYFKAEKSNHTALIR